jgi:hypothetical protein
MGGRRRWWRGRTGARKTSAAAISERLDAYERKRWQTEPVTPLEALKVFME